jgi:hypothetical protein
LLRKISDRKELTETLEKRNWLKHWKKGIGWNTGKKGIGWNTGKNRGRELEFFMPWRRSIVVIESAYRTKVPGFESRQGVRFFGIYTLQCCCHNLIRIVIVMRNNKWLNNMYIHKVIRLLHFKQSAGNLRASEKGSRRERKTLNVQ